MEQRSLGDQQDQLIKGFGAMLTVMLPNEEASLVF